jgi:thiol:disulfide interchange protein DsbD
MLTQLAARRFLTLIWLSLPFSGAFEAMGQTNLIESLESASGQAKPGDKPARSDIRPADVIHWTVSGSHYDGATKSLNVSLQLTTERQFTIYSDKLFFEASSGWIITDRKFPQTARQFDPISQKEVDVYTGGIFELSLTRPDATDTVGLDIKYVGCTSVICLFPYTEKITFAVPAATAPTVKPEAPAEAPAESQASESSEAPRVSEPGAPAAAPEAGTFEEAFAKKVKAGQMGLATLLLIAFIGGLLTNLTPCVAPMIPITIRLLAHQKVRPVASAALYASGIVVTYTTLGVIAAMSGALFGNLIAHPAVSITFGVVMFVLGVNMLGFGDLSKLQQIGGRIGSSKGGAFNSFLMGAGAGLVASPCTGPILAALLTYTAGRQSTLEAVSLLGIYSVGFALPYVFLGASAAKISAVRVNFQLQILTKLVFASVMFGLSLYFLRLPLYGLFTALRPWWNLIGLAGTIGGVLAGAAIIFQQNWHHKKALFLVPTLLFGSGIFFGIQGITRNFSGESETIVWLHSEEEARALAKSSGKPIIVDAWAEWCEACKKMDVTTFRDPDVITEIKSNWIALKFDLTEANDETSEISERYELPGLPTTTLLPASGEMARKVQITGYASAPALLEELRKNHTALSSKGEQKP